MFVVDASAPVRTHLPSHLALAFVAFFGMQGLRRAADVPVDRLERAVERARYLHVVASAYRQGCARQA